MTTETTTSKRPTVVVVGGGMAGLSAAGELLSREYRVILIERSRYLGGRAASPPDPKTGIPLDFGPHTIIESNYHVLDHLVRVGTRRQLSFAPTLTIPFHHPERGTVFFHCPPLPPPFGFMWGLAKYRLLSVSERFQTIRLGYQLGLRNFGALPDITIAQWLQNHLVTKHVRMVFWEPLIYAVLNDQPTNLSLLALARIFRKGFLAPGQRSGLALTDATWGELVVGNLPDRILSAGGQVITGRKVHSLIFKEGKVIGVMLDADQRITADAVIAAIPPRNLASMLSPTPSWLVPALEIPSSPIVSAHWIGVNPLPIPMPAALLDNPVQWVFSRKMPGSDRRVILSTITGGHRELFSKSSKEILSTLKEGISCAFPNWSPGKDFTINIRKVKNATLSIGPGGDALRPGPSTDIAGLWIAGDWTDTEIPPTLESAVISGLHAVRVLRV